jgi:hypothetical protein
VPQVAEWIARTDSSVCAAMAGHALRATTPEQVHAHVKAP